MRITEVRNYQEMSHEACDHMISRLKEKPEALFCIATGGSPTEAYRLFAERIKEEQIDASRMRIVKLDEWYGIPKNNSATCEHYIREALLDPLEISEDRYISFDPMAEYEVPECDRITKLLEEQGPIDCCILGIGRNGHLGLNEPGEQLNPFIHKANLAAKTKTHDMLTSNNLEVSTGYTLGIRDLLASRQIILLITGDGKKEAYEQLHQRTVSTFHPASCLWLHSNTTCIADISSM